MMQSLLIGLSVERLGPAPPDATPLVLSQNVTGEVAAPSAQNAFTFYGCASGTYEVAASLTPSQSNNVCFEVYDPTGTSVVARKCTNSANNGPVSVQANETPAQDGTCLIVVTSAALS
jgi:hypothetical protein